MKASQQFDPKQLIEEVKQLTENKTLSPAEKALFNIITTREWEAGIGRCGETAGDDGIGKDIQAYFLSRFGKPKVEPLKGIKKVTLKECYEDPNIKDEWAGRKVFSYCGQHDGYERGDHNGYVQSICLAGVFLFDDLIESHNDQGNMKQWEFHEATEELIQRGDDAVVVHKEIKSLKARIHKLEKEFKALVGQPYWECI